MKLWLDDERNPKDPYIQKMYGATSDMVWVKTVKEAINFLMLGCVTFISFDNDLGWFKEEGYDLAKWIEEKAFKKELKKLNWAIHTQNDVAFIKIQQAMRNADKYWSEN